MNQAAPTASPSTVDGAIVFTDLSGYTEFVAMRGDQAALELILTHETIIREKMGARGRLVKNLGDGFMLWFGDACDAIETALTLQDTFDDLSFEDDFPLWVRMGIHFGHPLKHGDDLVGHDVNLAARIVDLAGPGEVLVSEACTGVMKSPPEGVEFEEVGPVVMKGIPDAVTLFRAVRF